MDWTDLIHPAITVVAVVVTALLVKYNVNSQTVLKGVETGADIARRLGQLKPEPDVFDRIADTLDLLLKELRNQQPPPA